VKAAPGQATTSPLHLKSADLVSEHSRRNSAVTRTRWAMTLFGDHVAQHVALSNASTTGCPPVGGSWPLVLHIGDEW